MANERAKANLIEFIKSHIKTIFIGALAKVEESKISELWGYHKDENEILSEKEELWCAVWDNVRREILNNGNNQLRAIVQELSRYSIGDEQYNRIPVFETQEQFEQYKSSFKNKRSK